MYSAFVSFLFAIFIICIIATKVLRLIVNAHFFPIPVFICCLPAFLLPDVIIISTFWALLRRKNSVLGLLGFAVACIVCLVTLAAASSQLGFFYQTGGEINWADAASFAYSEETRKVLLSESATPLSFACAILLVSWIVKSWLQKLVGGSLSAAEVHARSVLRCAMAKTTPNKSNKAETESSLLPTREWDSDSDLDHDSDSASFQIFDDRLTDSEDLEDRAMLCTRIIAKGFTVLIVLGLVAIFTIFDPDRPYSRMLMTLPLPLLAAFGPKSMGCPSNSWPLPELIESELWEKPLGNYKGWAPGMANDIIQEYRHGAPEWLPSQLPDGFARWSEDARAGDIQVLLQNTTGAHTKNGCLDPLVLDPYYNPANDPMKITNLDNPFLEPLQQVLKDRSVKIKHIALILMESVREEVFPLQQGSGFHNLIMKSHDELDYNDINELLSEISPNAERITGLEGKWMGQDGARFGPKYSEWDDKTEQGFGGLSITGGLTTSSISTKSLASVHCGTWPLPVDMFEEAETESYQPCLPQILELFNTMKANGSSDDFYEQKWYPALFQSVTDKFDRQDKFDTKIGFKHIINRVRIEQDAGNDPQLKQINYFGYPETALKTYISDYITNAMANNQRMFMSHFTSTTHHPWATPKWFNTSQYMGTAHGLMKTHKDLNSYLNTIRFTDAWVGQLMQIFDDHDISNETLVIFVGDHGQAFKEDAPQTGTYGNPHISNHRVPITFRHPRLPRVQLRVNTTSVSILPTILDLLVNTDSLNPRDAAAAADLVQDYEGQSLIRPFKSTHKGRRAWNYSLVNPGSHMLTITSSDTSWRLVLPLHKNTEYLFSDLGSDPMELAPVSAWSIKRLASVVRGKFGEGAADWLLEAEKIGLWWASERKRLWNYEAS